MFARLLIAVALTLLVAVAGAVAAGVLGDAYPGIHQLGLAPAAVAAWIAALATWWLRGRLPRVAVADDFLDERSGSGSPVRVLLLIVAILAAVTVFFAHDRIANAFT
jgi:hypothetical protein